MKFQPKMEMTRRSLYLVEHVVHKLLLAFVFSNGDFETDKNELKKFCKSRSLVKKSHGPWNVSLMKSYTSLSPFSLIRKDGWEPTNFIKRLQWYYMEINSNKSEFELPIYSNLSNLNPFGMSAEEIEVDGQVNEPSRIKRIDIECLVHLLKKTQACMVTDDKQKWTPKQFR